MTERIKNSYNIIVVAALIFLGLTYLPILTEEKILDAFAREDRIYETLTPIYMLASCILFVAAFFLDRFG